VGPKRTLRTVLRGWIGVFALAAAVGLFGLPLWTMFVVAASAGFCLGGTWAADRPFMLRLTPPDRVGEFYGLYGMIGRFSAVTGPVLWGLVVYVCSGRLGMTPLFAQGVSICVLLLFMVTGYLVLGRFRTRNGSIIRASTDGKASKSRYTSRLVPTYSDGADGMKPLGFSREVGPSKRETATGGARRRSSNVA